MPRVRGEERWAAACIEAALPGVTAAQHDDGSRSSMHDLTLSSDGVAFAACEVTAAADPTSIELWNVLNGDGERWIEKDLLGGWFVTVAPSCRAGRLRRELPGILRRLEASEPHGEPETALADLGVLHARRGGTSFPGSIYVTIERASEMTGGVVATTGDPLVPWLDSWLTEPAQRHNLEKLRSAELPESHLFVMLPGFTSAPFVVADLLMRSNAPLPSIAPRLPDGLTDVWLMSTWREGDVFHCSRGRWERARKVS